MFIFLLTSINLVIRCTFILTTTVIKPTADGVLEGQHAGGHCLRAVGVRSAFSSFFFSLPFFPTPTALVSGPLENGS